MRLHRQGRLAGMPGALGDHRKTGGGAAQGLQRHHLVHTGHCQGCLGVQGFDTTADLRRQTQGRKQHAGLAHVDAELRSSGGFGRNVATRRGLAQQGPLFAGLQAHILGAQACRTCRKLPKMGRLARRVLHHARCDA